MDGENFNDWQQTASCELLRSRDPGVAMGVLSRTLETATRDMKLKPIDLTDPSDVGILSMIVGGHLRKVSMDGGTSLPDDGKALKKDEILALDGDLDADGDVAAQAKELLATLKGDLSSIASITIEPGEAEGTNFTVRIPDSGFKAHAAAIFASQLDTRLMFENLPPYARKEYSELLSVDDYVAVLAHLIHKYIGADGVDLAVSLVIFHVQNDERPGAQFQDPKMIDKILSASKEGKEGLLKQFLSGLEVPPESEEKVLKWALGTNFFDRLSTGNPDVASKMKVLQTLLETREDFRDKLLRAIRRLPAITDKQLASVFVRQGWRTLMGIDSVSDDEWWKYLRDSTQRMAADPEMQKGVIETDAQRARFQTTIADVEAYFREHPESEPSGVLQKLADEIGCKQLRKELEKLEKEHNPVAVASKQREIMHRVFGAITRYTHAESDQEKNPSYRAGFPVNVAKNKDTTCFSGPWLMSIMLFLSGIHYEDLLYCHVNETNNGQLGGHGAVLMKTRLREVMTIDHGFHFAGREFPFFFSDKEEMAKGFVGLLEGKIDQPVKMTFRRNAQLNRTIGYHPDVSVMPLGQGFASGHLLHVGIDFMHSGKLDEAKYALELGLSFNRADPDIWYYLGLVSLKEGDTSEAGFCFNEALKQFDGHLISHFSLGEMAMMNGNAEEALRRFKIVGEDKRKVWGDNAFQKRARRYATMTVSELQAAWDDGTFAAMEGISEPIKDGKSVGANEDGGDEESNGEPDYQI